MTRRHNKSIVDTADDGLSTRRSAQKQYICTHDLRMCRGSMGYISTLCRTQRGSDRRHVHSRRKPHPTIAELERVSFTCTVLTIPCEKFCGQVAHCRCPAPGSPLPKSEKDCCSHDVILREVPRRWGREIGRGIFDARHFRWVLWIIFTSAYTYINLHQFRLLLRASQSPSVCYEIHVSCKYVLSAALRAGSVTCRRHAVVVASVV
ncbi:hypothetical protein BDN70DRAFT_500332 [Pholiota conissans]|uniref:Uncharacterized protein n=1 Tax=Pholiota conissans TaxID=109636 RepID=A0A9P6CVK6_9AGAR|nr:hypothetical protein BDN70DRAFT_500332 [Pholiota conissans]